MTGKGESVSIPAIVWREGDTLHVDLLVDDVLDLTIPHEGVTEVSVEPIMQMIQIRKPEK